MVNFSYSKKVIIWPFKQGKRVIYYIHHFVLRRLGRIYIWFFVIPYLRYRENLSNYFTLKYTFNSIVIAERGRVFKVALNKNSTIGLEYHNLLIIRELYPALLNILPDYSMNERIFVKYLSAPCYEVVASPDSVRPTIEIFVLIRECCKPKVRMQVVEFAELVEGLNVISNVYGELVSQRIFKIVDFYLKYGKYHIGFAHGDFHSRNIVLDEFHRPRLIDLDCVRFCGVQELDAIYFLVEQEWSKSGTPWYETIALYLKNGLSPEGFVFLNSLGVEYTLGLSVTFLVDRIGQEKNNYGFNYTDVQLASTINEILAMPSSLATPHTRVETL